jgi:putative hemolysin
VMRFISRLAAPVVWFLNASSQTVLWLIGRGSHEAEQVTEEDVLSLVREGTEGGALEASERELIERVFEFTDSTAREIMTPRTEIVAASIDMPLSEVVDLIVESGYSRIPVYRGSLDTVEGILYAKDVLGASRRLNGDDSSVRLTDLLRPPVFVLEHQRIATVLQQFKQNRTHLALVLDEYGQVDGLLTLEDVLEELTGDIADEYDEADTMVVTRADGSWLVDGLLPYADAEDRLGLPPRDKLENLPSFDTVAGLLLALFERIPQAGESVRLGEWSFEVVDMDGMRIDKVLARNESSDASATDVALSLSAVRTVSDQPRRDSHSSRDAETGG